MSEVDYKICHVCNTEKSLSYFHLRKERGVYRADCKECVKNKSIEWRKNNFEQYKETAAKYKGNNREHIDKAQLAHRQKNREKLRIYAKEYHKNNPEKAAASKRVSYFKNRDKNLLKGKEWYLNNKERHAENRIKYEATNKDRLRAARRKWENDKLLNDAQYKLKNRISSRVRGELKGDKIKSERTESMLGCTIDELKIFIENQFQDGMNWNNWNMNGWHLDHRIPVSWFNLENENCRKLAFSYKNLQPLWKKDNLDKKNFYAHKMAS